MPSLGSGSLRWDRDNIMSDIMSSLEAKSRRWRKRDNIKSYIIHANAIIRAGGLLAPTRKRGRCTRTPAPRTDLA